MGAFGAALIANHGISWISCFVLSACYQLCSGLPRRGDSAETEEVAQDVAEALRKVGGDAGPSGLRRRQKLSIPSASTSSPSSKQPKDASAHAPVVERAFVDSFEEDAVPGK